MNSARYEVTIYDRVTGRRVTIHAVDYDLRGPDLVDRFTHMNGSVSVHEGEWVPSGTYTMEAEFTIQVQPDHMEPPGWVDCPHEH